MIFVVIFSSLAAVFFTASIACWMQSKTRSWVADLRADQGRMIGFFVAGMLSLIFGVALGLITSGVIR